MESKDFACVQRLGHVINPLITEATIRTIGKIELYKLRQYTHDETLIWT